MFGHFPQDIFMKYFSTYLLGARKKEYLWVNNDYPFV